jgi:hypothetical protein
MLERGGVVVKIIKDLKSRSSVSLNFKKID